MSLTTGLGKDLYPIFQTLDVELLTEGATGILIPDLTAEANVVNAGGLLSKVTAKSETSATGKERVHYHQSRQADHCEMAVGSEDVKLLGVSGSSLQHGVKADLKMDHAHHAANSKRSHITSGNLRHQSLTISGGRR